MTFVMATAASKIWVPSCKTAAPWSYFKGFQFCLQGAQFVIQSSLLIFQVFDQLFHADTRFNTFKQCRTIQTSYRSFICSTCWRFSAVVWIPVVYDQHFYLIAVFDLSHVDIKLPNTTRKTQLESLKVAPRGSSLAGRYSNFTRKADTLSMFKHKLKQFKT